MRVTSFSVCAARADFVDEPVVERFPGVEMTAAPHVLGDLLGGPAGELGEAGVEPPEQLLLLTTVRGDLVRRPREVCRRLEEPKPRGGGSRPVVGARPRWAPPTPTPMAGPPTCPRQCARSLA